MDKNIFNAKNFRIMILVDEKLKTIYEFEKDEQFFEKDDYLKLEKMYDEVFSLINQLPKY